MSVEFPRLPSTPRVSRFNHRDQQTEVQDARKLFPVKNLVGSNRVSDVVYKNKNKNKNVPSHHVGEEKFSSPLPVSPLNNQSKQLPFASSPPFFATSNSLSGLSPSSPSSSKRNTSSSSLAKMFSDMTNALTPRPCTVFQPPQGNKFAAAYPMGALKDCAFENEVDEWRFQHNRLPPWEKSPCWRPASRHGAEIMFHQDDHQLKQSTSASSLPMSSMQGNRAVLMVKKLEQGQRAHSLPPTLLLEKKRMQKQKGEREDGEEEDPDVAQLMEATVLHPDDEKDEEEWLAMESEERRNVAGVVSPVRNLLCSSKVDDSVPQHFSPTMTHQQRPPLMMKPMTPRHKLEEQKKQFGFLFKMERDNYLKKISKQMNENVSPDRDYISSASMSPKQQEVEKELSVSKIATEIQAQDEKHHQKDVWKMCRMQNERMSFFVGQLLGSALPRNLGDGDHSGGYSPLQTTRRVGY